MVDFSFNINSFQEVIANRQGLQQPNRYAVYIVKPPNVDDTENVINDIPFLVQNVSMPGRAIATSDYKTYGPVTKIARESIYADISMSFILTGDMAIKHFFDGWMNFIQDSQSYDPRYLDEYRGDIYIGQLSQDQDASILYDRNGAESFGYAQKIEDAFPTAIGDVTLGFSENNTYGTLQVTFTYRRTVNLKHED